MLNVTKVAIEHCWMESEHSLQDELTFTNPDWSLVTDKTGNKHTLVFVFPIFKLVMFGLVTFNPLSSL